MNRQELERKLQNHLSEVSSNANSYNQVRAESAKAHAEAAKAVAIVLAAVIAAEGK